LEQRGLPRRVRYIACRTHAQAARCIRQMSVRGAPAIGCVAAYGIVLAAREKTYPTWTAMKAGLEKSRALLAATRPTAVNLFYALERMRRVWEGFSPPPAGFQKAAAAALEAEAGRIADEDLASCLRIGSLGAGLLKPGSVILTHCNTGALATAGHGTALGIIRSAFALGKVKSVLVGETRPYLQGMRLTAWECGAEGIPYAIATDGMAGHFMRSGEVSAVIVGADRIAANGDTANKIGTYSLAVLARHHGVPFYVAAPFSTVDLKTPDGRRIPIEERSSEEVLRVAGVPLAPAGASARHPAFDVTPGELITAVVTDRGVARPPYAQSLAALSAL
jgi:methylthioribose-1-phosphate isomerase